MFEIVNKITEITPPFNMIVLIVLFCTCAGIITSIAKEIRKYVCHRQELEFKRELIDHGMSSQEIAQVVSTKLPSDE